MKKNRSAHLSFARSSSHKGEVKTAKTTTGALFRVQMKIEAGKDGDGGEVVWFVFFGKKYYSVIQVWLHIVQI